MAEVRTKYEILKSYIDSGQLNRVRDTWANLGQNTANNDTKTFIQDMIYQIVEPTSDMNGALVVCENSYYGPDSVNWSEAGIEDESHGMFSFVYGIITPHFRYLISGDDFNNILIPIDPTFVPYSEIETATIIIPESELETIMLETGVPFIEMEELEFPRNKICDLMVKPAMQEYFKYFPIVKVENKAQSIVTAGQEFKMEMPENAYGVVRALVTQGYSGTGSAIGNPLHFFANEIVLWGGGGSWSPIRYNSYKQPGFSNLQGFGSVALDRAARQGIMNYSTRFHFRIERQGEKKYLIGYANKMGTVEVHWAMASNDWDDIPYPRRPEVRKLSTAYVLRALGMLRSQVKEDIPGAIDFSKFVDRADKLEEEVLGFWKEIPRTAMLRGALG
jgi:hypothetical protein